MILDKLENQNLYTNINSNIKKAFEFLNNNDIKNLKDGKYEIDSDNVFALVQSYITKQDKENKWESHEKYIDIQYIVNGEETIVWSPTNQLAVDQEYSKEKDITFYKEANHFSKINLKNDYYCIFFPRDAHKPGCIFDKPMNIKKVVIKIKL
ncbi:YhcH/YjgK/YiaL family protein [Clostridium akagii]|uniref:YhcH/YjgK/YiaL family protein n=1 Tax=Clostridium akagii TaxID=91623 RepID=UPI00047BEBC3|nr:YhcH/YjgK/YiaL family protein [Clostridium akagii]